MKLRDIDQDDLFIEQGEESHKLKKWIGRMVGSWPWFLVCMFACLLAAYLYLLFADRVYLASASLMVKDKTRGVELVDDPRLEQIGVSSSSKLVVNEIEVLKSYDLIEAVVDSMQLFTSVKRVERVKDIPVFGDEIPFIVKVINPWDISKPRHWKMTETTNGVLFKSENDNQPVLVEFNKVYIANDIHFRVVRGVIDSVRQPQKKDTGASYKVDIYSSHQTALGYSNKLSVEPASKLATVINLELKDDNEKKVAAVLNTLLILYSQQGLRNKNRATDSTINFLNERLTAVANELRQVEGSVEKFKSQNKVTTLSSDADKFLDISQQVDAQKVEIQNQLSVIDVLEKDLEKNQDNNPQLVPSTLGIQDQSLTSLIEKHNELILQKERVGEKSGPKNPLLIDLQNQIKEIRSKLLTNVRNLRQGYASSLNNISRKDAELSSQIRNVPTLENKLLQITRSKEVLEQLYSFLLQKREEAVVSRVANIEDFQTIAKARDLGMVSPKSSIIWAFAVLMGFIMPIGIISLRSFMNNKIGDVGEVEERTGVPLLGIISHVKGLRTSVVINSNSRTAVAEQIRNIRTAINFSKRGVKTILVTSFQPGDGKSFVSLNLAAGYALLKKKTVMLEFDLRRPHISKDLGLNGHGGISNFLTEESKIDDLLVEVKDYNGYLFVIPAGNAESNPAELISGPNVPSLIQILQARFDYIIINTPPLNVVTDATLLEEYADVTLIVLRQDHTSRDVYNDVKHHKSKHPDASVYLLLNDVGKRKVYQGRFDQNYGYYHEEKR